MNLLFFNALTLLMFQDQCEVGYESSRLCRGSVLLPYETC